MQDDLRAMKIASRDTRTLALVAEIEKVKLTQERERHKHELEVLKLKIELQNRSSVSTSPHHPGSVPSTFSSPLDDSDRLPLGADNNTSPDITSLPYTGPSDGTHNPLHPMLMSNNVSNVNQDTGLSHRDFDAYSPYWNPSDSTNPGPAGPSKASSSSLGNWNGFNG